MNILTFGASAIDVSPLPHIQDSPGQIHTILGIVFGIVGALALLFITIGGFRYVISTGDPGKITSAKNTILYSVIGLVVAIAAEAIVGFVLGNV